MDYVRAFIVGGAICVIGQLLMDLTKLTPARVLVTFVTLGVILHGFGIYQPIVDFRRGGGNNTSYRLRIYTGEGCNKGSKGGGYNRSVYRRLECSFRRHSRCYFFRLYNGVVV